MGIENERADFWRGHFAAWQRSGLSQRAYCEQHGLSYSAFGYWRGRAGDTSETSSQPPPAFVPALVAPPAPVPLVESAPGPSGRIGSVEVRLAHGRSLVLAGDFDEALLALVVRAVEQAPC
jgi:hypothetical protein